MIAALLLLFLAVDDWEVVDRSGDVVTSARIDDEPFSTYRGTMVIAAGLFDILAVLHDVGTSCEWMPRCRTVELIRHTSDFSSLIYLRNASPWLVWDRDAVIETRVRIEADGGEARASFRLRTLASHPPVAGVVRIARIEGAYVLRRMGESRTEVEYTTLVDPGGMLPRLVSERALWKAPRETLLALEKRTLEMRGRYPEFLAKYVVRRAARAPPSQTDRELNGVGP